MSNKPLISLEEMSYWLHYDPETGIFTRINGYRKGCQAGVKCKDGYIVVNIHRKRYYAHLLAWWMTHGYWPTNVIDHINRDKADNSIANLREATISMNLFNSAKRKTNKSGYKGVVRYGDKWRSHITINYKKVWLGYFDSPEKAHAAYCQAVKNHANEYAGT